MCGTKRLWIAAIVLIWAAAPLSAAELLVTNFTSNFVGRYELSDGSYNGVLAPGHLRDPLATRIGPDGLLYVADEFHDAIQRFDLDTGAFVDTFVASGAGGLDAPTGITWGPDGNLYVPSFNTDSILKYDGDSGAFLGTFVTAGLDGLDGPDNGTIFGPDGDLYVPSYFGNVILRFDGDTGASLGAFTPSLSRPRVLEFHDDGLLYVTAQGGDRVKRYDAATGAFIDNFITPTSGGLDSPVGLAYGDGYWYVASSTQNRVNRYDANGVFVEEFLNSSDPGIISAPVFLTITPEPATMLLLLGGAALIRRCSR